MKRKDCGVKMTKIYYISEWNWQINLSYIKSRCPRLSTLSWHDWKCAEGGAGVFSTSPSHHGPQQRAGSEPPTQAQTRWSILEPGESTVDSAMAPATLGGSSKWKWCVRMNGTSGKGLYTVWTFWLIVPCYPGHYWDQAAPLCPRLETAPGTC